MSITAKIPYDGQKMHGQQWQHNGNTYSIYDAGMCYYYYFNGKFSGAIDSAADADYHAIANHYAGESVAVTANFE